MSLRTRLLAAVVGLNGAMLLLVLYLMLRGEGMGPGPRLREHVSDLVGLGSALGRVLEETDATPHAREERARQQAVDWLRRLLAADRLRDPHVVLELGPDQESGYGVWRAEEVLRPVGLREEVPDGPERRAAITEFARARQHGNRFVSGELVAVAFPFRTQGGGHGGLVARVAEPADPRAGLRGVYLVMVVGVILLSGFSFWLISRLVIRPLRQLTEAAGRIARGDYRIEIPQRGTNDEFDRTISAFNRMAREIAEYQGHLEDRVMVALNRMRKAEQHLTIAQRLAATGKLASGVAHEINNPLGGMKNALRALERGDLPAEKTSEYLTLVAEGLARIEETVKTFLSFTPRRVEPRVTDLAEVVQKALVLASHRLDAPRIEVRTVLPSEGEVLVFGDPHELQQVALNLLLNAVDALAPDAEGAIEVLVRRGGEEAVLQVRDTGRGMTPQEQDRCFDLFFTTKEAGRGTGLGLAVVHTIVTNHGGRIEVESAPGRGSAFRVVLPAEASAEEGRG